MNRALWLLLWLQLVGWLRYLGRSLATIRGLLLALVGVAVFFPWLLAVIFGGSAAGGISPENMRKFGPALLVAYCVMNVLISSHERAIYFTPAEVQFLFTGPFGRRQVLLYKLLLTLLVSVPATVIMAAVVRVRHGWPLAMLLGLLLVSIFMQLFTIALGLVANAVGEQIYGRGRKVAFLALLVLATLLVLQAGPTQVNWSRLGTELLDTPLYRVVSWPLLSFFQVMVATDLNSMVGPLLVAASVLLGLLGVIFLLDAHYLEAAAAASARTYAKLQRFRGRAVTVEEAIRPTPARGNLPMPPFLGGIGPIFWRQLTSAMRGLGRLFWVLLIVMTVVAVAMSGSNLGRDTILFPTLVGLAVWLTIFLTAIVPYDFRGDIDRMAVLKTLPIRSWCLALGQLLTPTLILTLILWLLLGAACLVAPVEEWLVLAVAAFAPPFAFLIIAIENLLFLFFPVRLMAATPGDFQALGRNVLLGMGKLVGLGLTGTVAALIGVVVYLLTQQVGLALAAAWAVVALAGLALVPLIGLAFTWFDVGRDVPA